MLVKCKRFIRRCINAIYKNQERWCFLKKVDGNVHSDIEIRGHKYIETGLNCCIGENSKLLCISEYLSGIKPQRLNPHLKIGSNFHATRRLVIQCGGSVTIGKDVLIASNVFIIDYNHGLDASTVNYLDNPLLVKNISIGDGVWICNDVIILPGVTIGEKSIIAAGSVVTKAIPSYSIAAGNPAKVIKKWDKNSQRWLKL